MQLLNQYIDLILLSGVIVTLLLIFALWARQNTLVRNLKLSTERQGEGVQRLEELLRNQERQLLDAISREGEKRKEEGHSFQQRHLLQISKLYQALERRFGEMQKGTADEIGALKLSLSERLDGFQQGLDKAITENRLAQQQELSQGIDGVARQLAEGLLRNTETLGKRVDVLTASTDQRLQEISGQVEKRLSEGFEKTTETFTRVLEHLSRIDEAQKRITELSSNVVSLQEVLADKRSRGAFGEVQLNGLVSNLLPERSFALQHTLSSGARADCMLFLPEPTGNICIDAKFPLESFRRLSNNDLNEGERNRAASQFRVDIRKHIDDIANKYILPGETADGAVMFIPAEAVFAEIHATFPELVDEAHRRRVWLVSPTTMMAILTTARAVLKDAATREQVHIIQQHLHSLSKDFGRFQSRMDKLAGHIRLAHQDVDEVNISARKISHRFGQIEQVELDEPVESLPSV
ncbi:MAG: DNA recombination protein RmuC [Candidatus Sedimenticola sp. (ex Thyasira tokunagai)]